MLDSRTKEELQKRYFPSLEQLVFGPLHNALSRAEFEGATVLDAGCGKGTWILKPYKPRFHLLVGMDIYDPPNNMADAFTLGTLEGIPFRDASFDLVMCYLVLEHVKHPDRVFGELGRVLKPGGTLIFKTPAAYAPTGLLTRLLPHKVHCDLKGLIGVASDDVFPTYFRCNTLRDLRRLLENAGFSDTRIARMDQTYAYLSFNRFTYTLGLLYSRAMHHPWFRWLRNGIVGISRKVGEP